MCHSLWDLLDTNRELVPSFETDSLNCFPRISSARRLFLGSPQRVLPRMRLLAGQALRRRTDRKTIRRRELAEFERSPRETREVR